MVSHNPGLSPEAWKKVNRLLAKLNIKYGAKLTQMEKEMKAR